MRCRRCRAKIDPKSGRKNCPVCGVLIQKNKRLKIDSQVGIRQNFILDFLERLSPRVLIAIPAAVIFFIVCIFIFTNCGASCGDGDKAAAPEKTGCAGDADAIYTAQISINSAPLGKEYCLDDTLYYIFGDSIVALREGGESSIVAAGQWMAYVSADGENVYYMRDGSIWSAPLEKPIVISSDSDAKYAAERIVSPAASVSASDDDAIGVIQLYGYALGSDGYIYFWGLTEGGKTRICRADKDGGNIENIHTGTIGDIKYYRDKLYYYDYVSGRAELCSVAVSGREVVRAGVARSAEGYALGDGCVYYCAADIDGGAEALFKKNLTTGRIEAKWQISGVSGVLANDAYIFYWKNGGDGGKLIRMSHSGEEAVTIFKDSAAISLQSVCGRYISVYVNVGANGQPAEDSRYYLIDTETGQRVY